MYIYVQKLQSVQNNLQNTSSSSKFLIDVVYIEHLHTTFQNFRFKRGTNVCIREYTSSSTSGYYYSLFSCCFVVAVSIYEHHPTKSKKHNIDLLNFYWLPYYSCFFNSISQLLVIASHTYLIIALKISHLLVKVEVSSAAVSFAYYSSCVQKDLLFQITLWLFLH